MFDFLITTFGYDAWLNLFTSPEAWIALLTLTALEIVLGVDNIIFISILVSKLPEHQRDKARKIGLGLAMVTRLLLLLSIGFIMSLTEPVFSVMDHNVTWRDIILFLGGLFLVGKSVHEIHNTVEGSEDNKSSASLSFGFILIQIAIIDIVFSLDSVITAVGLADQVLVMMLAVIISVAVMMFSAKTIGDFVDRHPSIKVLALSFLILVGFTLAIEAFGQHVPKGYIYFAMAFAFIVEVLNIKARSKTK